MKINQKTRRNLLIGGVLVAVTATPSFALFGLGDIVFDPTSYASLISQLSQMTTQYNMLKNNLTHFSLKAQWQTALNQMEHVNVANQFGETNGMTTALNTNSPTAATMAWTNASVPVSSSTSTYLAGQQQGSTQMSQLAMIEASDAASPDCMNAVGAYRAARDANSSAQQDLQAQQLDGNDGTNTEVQQLNLLNASQAQHLQELQAQGVIHACLAQQMAINNMQQRNAAAQDLNTWAFVQQQHTANPAFTGGGSDTNSFLP
jgi:hypothetical protein